MDLHSLLQFKSCMVLLFIIRIIQPPQIYQSFGHFEYGTDETIHFELDDPSILKKVL